MQFLKQVYNDLPYEDIDILNSKIIAAIINQYNAMQLNAIINQNNLM